MNAILAGFRVQLGQTALTPLMLLEAVLEPVVYGLLVTASIGRPTMATLVGVGFVGIWGAVISAGAFAVVRDKHMRTLELTLAAPSPIGAPLAGVIVAGILNGLVAIPVAWGIIALVWSFPAGDLALAAAALAVGSLGFLAYGLVLAGLLARHRFFAGMLTGAYDVVAVLACFFVPASFLPGPLNAFSAVFGARWALEGVRAGSDGWGRVGLGLCVSLVTLGLAVLYLQRLDRSIRAQPEGMLA
jgi:hypothetical protein